MEYTEEADPEKCDSQNLGLTCANPVAPQTRMLKNPPTFDRLSSQNVKNERTAFGHNLSPTQTDTDPPWNPRCMMGMLRAMMGMLRAMMG
eukprot:1178924-Prorocentrum_minimum.AAC.1